MSEGMILPEEMKSERRQRAIEQGRAAGELLSNPAIKAAFDGLQAMALELIEGARDESAAYRATVYLQQLKRVRQSLEVAIAQGASAAQAQYREQERMQRERDDAARVRDKLTAARIAREEFEQQSHSANRAEVTQ